MLAFKSMHRMSVKSNPELCEALFIVRFQVCMCVKVAKVGIRSTAVLCYCNDFTYQ